MKSKAILLILWVLSASGGAFVLAQPQGGDSLEETLNAYSGLNEGQKNMILSSMGVPDVSNFSAANLIGSLIFGGIGFSAFVYGKKMKSLKPLLIGIILMVYPYFLGSVLWIYAVGCGLCLLLYFWRD